MDCDVPSFSLGLDLGSDSEPQFEQSQNQTPVVARQSPVNMAAEAAKGLEVEESGPHADDSDPESGPAPPRRVLKRLRRGPAEGPSTIPKQAEQPQPSCPLDEDIEEFSSDDEHLQDEKRLTQNQFTHSSSKMSSNGSRVLASSLSLLTEDKTGRKVSDPSTSDGLKSNKIIFSSKLTTDSPLRRFQLIDSDSDYSSIDEDICEESHHLNSSSKARKLYPEKTVISNGLNGKRSLIGACNEDLWKDFSPVKTFKIATPALDEVCKEYFRSADINKLVQERTRSSFISKDEGLHEVTDSFHNGEQFLDCTVPVPPSHQYFFHNDPRVRTMVRERLRNFSPVGLVNKENHENGPSAIDYMGQFGNGEASKHRGTQKSSTRNNTKESSDASGCWVNPRNICSLGNGNSSKRKATERNNVKRGGSSKGKSRLDKSDTAGFPSTSECWVDPKSSAKNMPRDAAKRRVQASSQSAGHWYTASDGKKVYVTRNGQELTGQIAYRHYRKESGSGFKSKKKTSGKRRGG